MMIPIGMTGTETSGRKPGETNTMTGSCGNRRRTRRSQRRGENRRRRKRRSSASEKRREKAGAVILQRKLPEAAPNKRMAERRSGQRNPQGNRVNRRIYDRYRIYRGNCGAGFYGSVGCAPAEKSAGVSAGQIVLFARKGRSVMRICGIMQIRFFLI